MEGESGGDDEMSWGDPRGVAVASESWWESVSPMELMIVFCMICSSALLGSAAEYIGWGCWLADYVNLRLTERIPGMGSNGWLLLAGRKRVDFLMRGALSNYQNLEMDTGTYPVSHVVLGGMLHIANIGSCLMMKR